METKETQAPELDLSGVDPALLSKIVAMVRGNQAPKIETPPKEPEAPIRRRPFKPRTRRAFDYRGLDFLVNFENDIARVSVIDPKNKQPSLRAVVTKATYMKAVQAVTRILMAENEIRLLEEHTKRNNQGSNVEKRE